MTEVQMTRANCAREERWLHSQYFPEARTQLTESKSTRSYACWCDAIGLNMVDPRAGK
jgi:hypothetical protein